MMARLDSYYYGLRGGLARPIVFTASSRLSIPSHTSRENLKLVNTIDKAIDYGLPKNSRVI
jgi:hypothetical protein